MPQDQTRAGLVNFNLITTGNEELAFDPELSTFVAPAFGFYQFYFNVTCSVASFQNVDVQLLVNGTTLYSSLTGCPANQVQTISGSCLLQLLPDQKVTIQATCPSGALLLKGPVVPGAPPYPTVFSGFSLF